MHTTKDDHKKNYTVEKTFKNISKNGLPQSRKNDGKKLENPE